MQKQKAEITRDNDTLRSH